MAGAGVTAQDLGKYVVCRTAQGEVVASGEMVGYYDGPVAIVREPGQKPFHHRHWHAWLTTPEEAPARTATFLEDLVRVRDTQIHLLSKEVERLELVVAFPARELQMSCGVCGALLNFAAGSRDSTCGHSTRMPCGESGNFLLKN